MTSDATTPFEQALATFDFDAARQLVATASGAEREALQSAFDVAHDNAEQRGEQLAGRIQSMARADHYEGLLALVDDDTTESLLRILAPEIQRGARLHLDGAVRRQQRFQTAAVTHMDDAREALVLLDTTKARSLLHRVDRRWLSSDLRADLDGLLEQTEAAAAERRDLDARTAKVLRDHHPSQAGARRGGGDTPTRARGCSATLAILGLIAGAIPVAIGLF